METIYCGNCVCECGATYDEHECRDGRVICPIDDDTQTFSPFALLWPINTLVN
jgi:hypothetical protein